MTTKSPVHDTSVLTASRNAQEQTRQNLRCSHRRNLDTNEGSDQILDLYVWLLDMSACAFIRDICAYAIST